MSEKESLLHIARFIENRLSGLLWICSGYGLRDKTYHIEYKFGDYRI